MSAVTARHLRGVERVAVTGVAATLIAVGFLLGGGAPGGVVVLAVGVGWLLGDERIAAALAAVGLGVLAPLDPVDTGFVLAGVGVALGGGLLRETRAFAAFAAFAAASTVLAGVVVLAEQTTGAGTWLPAAAALGAFALVAYGVHRYERLVLDLLPTNE